MTRPSKPDSYIVDLETIAGDILCSEPFRGGCRTDVVIPVYNNSFGRSTAENMVFLAGRRILQSIKSDFLEAVEMDVDGGMFRFWDKFREGNECGYKFGSMLVPGCDNGADAIILSYYWR